MGRRAPAFLVGRSDFNALAGGFSRFRASGCKLSRAMPRRSDADLSIVPMLPGKGRPEPPKALDQIEARAWNDVIDALPGHWIDAAAQIVLRRVAAQVAIAERVEARLRDLALMGDDPEALEAETAARRHASGDREIGCPRADGVAGDADGAAWRRAKGGASSSAARAPSGRGKSSPRRPMGRPRKQRPPPGPVTAADVIAFIETVCFVPEGKFVGQPLKLQDWQKDILRAIYDNPARHAARHHQHGAQELEDDPVGVSFAGASVRPAGPEQSRTRNCTPPLRAATRRPSSSRSQRRWFG